jgi:hypothetical protein
MRTASKTLTLPVEPAVSRRAGVVRHTNIPLSESPRLVAAVSRASSSWVARGAAGLGAAGCTRTQHF